MRLIDADALKNAFSNMYREDYERWIKEVIDNTPTIESEPNDCVLKEFGKCSYKETGCSDCKIKSNLRYMCHGSAWQELQALREFKEKHEKKGKWIEYDDDELYAGECSCCKWKAVLYESNVLNMNFCPNCGAKNGLVR